MADLSAYLSPADRAKLARQVGITLDDGRQFRRGVMVSAQDAANSAATGARNAAFSAQTGQYGDRSGTIDANKVGAQAYEAYLANPRSVGIAQSAPQPAAAPAGAPNAAQPAAPQAGAPAPADDLLNRARLMAQYQGQQGVQPPAPAPAPGFQMAAGPNISTAPTGLPQGSIGMQRANGQYTVEAPMGPGMGTQTFGSEQQAQQAFAGMPSFAPQPAPAAPALMQTPAQPSAPAAPVAGFLPGGGGYTPQQITAMSPQQRSALVAFNTEQAAAAAPREVKVQSYRSQDAQGNPIEVSVDQFGRPLGSGPVRPTAQTNITVDKGANKAEEVIGEAAGNDYLSIESQAQEAERASRLAQDVETLYSQGAYSGPGADVAGFFRRGAATFGVNIEGAATQDQLEQRYSENALMRTKELYKGLGALSNLEGKNAEKTVANLGRTPEGNLQILRWQAGNAPTLRQAVDLRDKLRDEGKPVEQINREVKKFIRENYKNLGEFKGTVAAGGGSTPAAGAPAASSPDIEAILNKYR